MFATRLITLRRGHATVLAILAVCTLLMASVVITPTVSFAHARIKSATPAEGATVPAGLTQVVLIFTEEIDVDQSTAELLNASGSKLSFVTAAVDRADRTKMTVKTRGLPAGKYQVKWRAVTPEDNGITNGTLNFTVAGVSDCRDFKETGKKVCGRFLEYWDWHGNLTQQGLPISEEMQEKSDTDGKTYKVQYFERAVFELHPENAPPNDVLLSLLGNFLYKQKYPNGAPGQKPNTSVGAVLFKETGKRVGGKFLDYWNNNGGLAQQGYPISDEFQEQSETDGKTYTVQYFERAVMEMHPENKPPYDVLLSQLGTFRYKQVYPSIPGN